MVLDFMTTYNLPSVSFAVTKDGKMIYDRSFGTVKRNVSDSTLPHHMYRLASISKPITSIAIMKMIEEGKFSFTDTVFGPNGLLANHPDAARFTFTDNRILNITVQNLLDHSAGWDRDLSCFPNPTSPYSYQASGCDPINAPLHITQTLGVANPVKEEDYIVYLLQKGLDFCPRN